MRHFQIKNNLEEKLDLFFCIILFFILNFHYEYKIKLIKEFQKYRKSKLTFSSKVLKNKGIKIHDFSAQRNVPNVAIENHKFKSSDGNSFN